MKQPQWGSVRKPLLRMSYNLVIGTSSSAYIQPSVLQRVDFNRTESSPFQSATVLEALSEQEERY